MSREKLENDVVNKYRANAKTWNISESEAVERANELIPYNSDKELEKVLKTPVKAMSVNSLDPAHRDCDLEIGKISREVQDVYTRASKEMQEKLDKYLQRFQKDVDAKQKELADGKITEKEYKDWYRTKLANKALRTKTWAGLRDNLAQNASNSNDIARSIIYEHMPDVYANNFNFGTYMIEKNTGIDTSFTLYDRDTVERLMREGQQLLPPPPDTEQWRNTGIDVAKGVTAKKKDIAWNSRAIQNELIQGILQGESIPDLSKRIRHVQLMNNRASVRYARTMTTGAENAGRNDSYERARKGGIDVRPQWMATLDGRTRDSHRALDGEVQGDDGKFSNGCRFPGDPEGRPEEVYNCRCTEVAHIAGLDKDFSDTSWRPSQLLQTMSYDEWKTGHAKQKDKTAVHSESYNRIKSNLDVDNVAYFKLNKLQEKGYSKDGKVKWDFTNKACEELGGGDLTKGSCVSLSLAFAGRMAGYDVHDFRGGRSLSFFSHNGTIKNIINLPNVNGSIETKKSDYTSALNLLSTCEKNKLYILVTGKHAAVVTRTDKNFQYLEMQSSDDNGWKRLTNSELKNRFGCKKSHSIAGRPYEASSELIDVESLTHSDEFLDLLGYINTPIDEQLKGDEGYER